jgi:hypothetical protein
MGILTSAAMCLAQQIPTTANDFRAPGSQPNSLFTHPVSAINCANCHAFYAESIDQSVEVEPFTMWSASMMGQAGRDPIFHAALYVANHDAAFAGEYCLRCHAPMGWIGGRSADPTGNSLTDTDFEGVSCSICHRMVDPVYAPGRSPLSDAGILAALTQAGDLPGPPHSAEYVLDPDDVRRGPYALNQFHAHSHERSPFHKRSEMCATCHDISNPVYARQPNGTYALTAMDQPAPSFNKYDQFPVERTYSEWANSQFARGPVDMGGRFGGNNPSVSSCQDCHMARTDSFGCGPGFGAEQRGDLARHFFPGGNTWVLRAVRSLYPDYETFLSEQLVQQATSRTIEFLEVASDVQVTIESNRLDVRVINQTGHKLPTGYNEGRRMWINVVFYDANGFEVTQYGRYNYDTAELETSNTKVYEAKAGLDAAVAAATGKPEGESFHFALNNVWLKDNRIPPRGFTNAAFEAVQAAPVGATYADGQYWDDTSFRIPGNAAYYEVGVYFQTTSKEYIEFLRDIYPGNVAAHVAYDQWVLHGKSEPALMDYDGGELPDRCPADWNNDGGVDGDDVIAFFAEWNNGVADYNFDDGTDGDDVIAFFADWNTQCGG